MAHIYRLIFVFVFSFFINSSVFSFPANDEYKIANRSSFSTASAACQDYASTLVGYGSVVGTLKSDGYCELRKSDGYYITRTKPILISVCPDNSSSPAPGECACNAGFEEKDGACSPKCESGSTYNNLTGYCQPDTPDDDTPKGPCDSLKNTPLGLSDYGASFGTKSADWMKNQIGKPTNSCFPGGCVVSGEATGCAGGGTGSTYCKIANPTFTGASCSESENPGDDDNCAAGYKASEYVPGVCIPDGSDDDDGTDDDDSDGLCPDKTDPTKRVPCEGKPSKCSGGLCESKYVPGLCIPCDTSVNGDGTTTTCNPTTGKCTTTNPDGTTDEQDKADFCRENPKSPMCIENKWGGGSCTTGVFSCEGDAIQCAIAKEQHKMNCKLFTEDKEPTSLFNKAASGNDESSTEKLKGQAQQINVSTFDQSGFGWSRSCPADPVFTIPFARAEFSIPFSKVCPILSILSSVAVGITLLGSLIFVLGVRKGG